jgi:hypothetical protein
MIVWEITELVILESSLVKNESLLSLGYTVFKDLTSYSERWSSMS